MLGTYFSRGRTDWESSYFGGVKRILYEYPFYSLNYDLIVRFGFNTKVDKELSLYQADKLANILFNLSLKKELFRIRFKTMLKEGLSKTVNNEQLFKERLIEPYGYEKPCLLIPVSKDLIRRMLYDMKSSELASLYEEYGESFMDNQTELLVKCPLPGSDDEEERKENRKKRKNDDDYWKDASNFFFDCEKRDAYFDRTSLGFINKFKDKSLVDSKFSVSGVNVKTNPHNPVVLTNSEVLFAKKLHQLLDITHDPKIDVVKNLLQGSMDTEKLAEVLSGNNRVYYNRLEQQSVKPFKVVVLGDYSASMIYGEYEDTSEGVSRNITKFEFQSKVMKALFHLFHDIMQIKDVEFYGHSGSRDPILYKFHSPEYPHFMESFRTNIPLCENYDGPILEHIHKTVRSSSDKAVLLISLSDGHPSGVNYGGFKAHENMKKIMEKMKRDNFITVGIGMIYSCQPDLYQYAVDLMSLTEVSPIARIINRAVKENLVMED